MSLILHCGGYAATRKAVDAVPTPMPTDTWRPVAHSNLLETLHKEISGNHMIVTDEALALMRDGARMFGYLEVSNGCNHPDYKTVIGIRNSHDQSFPIGLAVGHHVMICDNLALSGEVVISTKHTIRVMDRMPMLINRAMGMLMEKRVVMDERIRIYKDCEISDAQAHDLMIRAMSVDIVPPSKLRPVLDQWRQPAYPDFAPRTMWSLFNAFTHILKENPTQEHQRRTLTLHGLCDMAAGLDLATLDAQIQAARQKATDAVKELADDEVEVVVAGSPN
jgi:hypothetical protein